MDRGLTVLLGVDGSTHQLVEDVSLMDVNGDERLVLGPLVPAQVPGRHVDQLIEKIQELLVGCLHDLPADHKQDNKEIQEIYLTIKPSSSLLLISK